MTTPMNGIRTRALGDKAEKDDDDRVHVSVEFGGTKWQTDLRTR